MNQNLNLFGLKIFSIHPKESTEPPSLIFTPESDSVVVLSRPGHSDPNTLTGFSTVHGGVRQYFLPPWVPRLGRKYEGSVDMTTRFYDLAADQSNSLDGQKVMIDGRMRWQVIHAARFAVWARGFTPALQQSFSSAANVFTADHTAETLISMPYRAKVAEAWAAAREELWAAALANHDDDVQENTQIELLANLHTAMRQLETQDQNFKYLAAVSALEEACCNDMEKQLAARFGVKIIDVKVQSVSAPNIQVELTNQRRAEIAQKAAQAQAREFKERLKVLQGAEWKAIFGVFLDRVADLAANKLAGAVRSAAPHNSGGGSNGGDGDEKQTQSASDGGKKRRGK